MTIRSLARCVAAALVAVGLGLAPLRAADEPPAAGGQNRSTAEAKEGASGPAPAPSEPLTAPVMPITVVTPTGVQDEGPSAGKTPPASAATAAVEPRPAAGGAKPAAQESRRQAPSRSLRDHRAVELGSRVRSESRWHGFPISLSLRDAPLPEVLRSFARLAGMNLVLDPHVQGTVTVELHEVPWDQALYVILKTHGLAAEIDGQVWLVEPR